MEEIVAKKIRPGNLIKVLDVSSDNAVRYSPFVGYCLGIMKSRFCRVYDRKHGISKDFPLHTDRFSFVILQDKFTRQSKPNFIKSTSQVRFLRKLKSVKIK